MRRTKNILIRADRYVRSFFILILLKRNAFCVFLEVFRTGQDQNTLYEAPNFRNDCQSKARKNGNQQLCNRFSDITEIKVMYAKSTQQNAKNTCGNLRFRSSCPRNTSSRSRGIVERNAAVQTNRRIRIN